MPLVNSVINGKPQAHINIEDRALHYGDGLFETMLYHNGKIALWPQHIARLSAGCSVLGLNSYSDEQLQSDLQTLTKDLKGDSYIIKLMVSRGASGRGLNVDKSCEVSCIFLAYDFDIEILKEHKTKRLTVCETRLLMNRTLGGIKHLNRLLYVLAADELDHQFQEGIMLNDASEMIECITHNLFFVKSNTLYTAPIENCGVAGIKRQQVLNLAKSLGIATQIKAIPLNDLKLMDECFITNAVVGVQSVKSIDDVLFTKNIMTSQLQNSLQRL